MRQPGTRYENSLRSGRPSSCLEGVDGGTGDDGSVARKVGMLTQVMFWIVSGPLASVTHTPILKDTCKILIRDWKALSQVRRVHVRAGGIANHNAANSEPRVATQGYAELESKKSSRGSDRCCAVDVGWHNGLNHLLCVTRLY